MGDGYLWSSKEIDMIDGSDVLAEPGPLSNTGHTAAFPISWLAKS